MNAQMSNVTGPLVLASERYETAKIGVATAETEYITALEALNQAQTTWARACGLNDWPIVQ